MPINKKEVARWFGEIEVARRFQKRFGDQQERWRKNVKAMAGDFSDTSTDDEAVDVNMVKATMDTMLPPLYINDPHIIVIPTTDRGELANGQQFDNIMHAEMTEVEINYWMRELKVKRVIKRAVIDTEATNHGYAYVGYSRDNKDIVIDGERREPRPEIRVNHPFVKRLAPKDVLLPPGINDLEDALWVDILIRWFVKDARKRFGVKDLEPTQRIWEHDNKQDKPINTILKEFLASEESGLVILHQIWDKRKKRVYTLAEGHDAVLEDKPWPNEVDGEAREPPQGALLRRCPDRRRSQGRGEERSRWGDHLDRFR
jgi:hypothetical protein